MYVNNFLLAANPFFDAYIQSDFLGKLIFVGLVMLSIVSWSLMIHKYLMTRSARQNSQNFYNNFQNQKGNLLVFDQEIGKKKEYQSPYFNLFSTLKRSTVDLLNKNHRHLENNALESVSPKLSPTDMEFIEGNLATAIATEVQILEKNLFILSTVVSLGPFLGLLGTVWGILISFSEMQTNTSGNANQMILGGISLALATTVLGLIDAIPALIGYNYLKNSIYSFQTEMEGFSNQLLSSVEIQYRKVDIL